MSRTLMLSITAVFLTVAIAVALVGGAQATNPVSLATQLAQVETPVERCSLQPNRVQHPTNGAMVLVLERTC